VEGTSDVLGRGRAFAASFALLAAILWVSAAPASAQAVTVTTEPSLYPAFDPSVTDYMVRCSSNTPVAVTVSAPAGTTVDVGRHGPLTGSFSALVGLNPGQSFIVWTDDGTTTMSYVVRCLPSDFPSWTFQRSATPQVEWFTASPISGSPPAGVSRNYVMIFDTNGVPVWWAKAGQEPLDFHLFPDGNVAWTNFTTGNGEEHKFDGSLARTIAPALPATLDAHELLQLPNGNLLMSVARQLPGRTACGQPNLTILDNGYEELAPDGSLVSSWWASDHIPLAEVPAAWCTQIIAQPANGVYDTYHINSVEPDGDGFVMSFRHLNAVYRVGAAGSVTWKLGGVQRSESLTPLNDAAPAGDTFRGQHDARILSDGTLSVHDNGFNPGGLTRAPRAVRFSLDFGAHTATLIQQVNDPSTLSAAGCCGSARTLPGGDWLMSWGNDNLITELTATGDRVFSLSFQTGFFSYRSHAILPGQLSREALHAAMDVQFPRGYPRPRGASRVRVALVPAFSQCTAPNRTHGAPLSYGSCSSPSTNTSLTIGTPDANGAASSSLGSVAYKAHFGNPSNPASASDLNVSVSITDVRRASDLTDYTGELQLRGNIRITDRLGGGGLDEAGTVQDMEVPATIPCAATASTVIGATCALATTVNAIVPGAIVNGKRAIWELGSVRVYDGGASETAGAADARLFETQGLFVP
jgi:hypothetical protein